MRNELTRQIRHIVGDVLETDGETISPQARLIEDLGMDSMKALEILAALEKIFKIRIPEDNLPKLTTLEAIVAITAGYADAKK